MNGLMLDCHAHIISGDREKFPPAHLGNDKIDQLIDNAFDSERLIGAMDDQGVDRALVVQRGQIYGFDNSYVCTAAQASCGRFLAVCNINGRDPGNLEQARICQAEGAAGYRLMGRPDEIGFDWLDGPDCQPFWRWLADEGAVICVHLFPSNRDEGLARLAELLAKYPVHHLVIDHLANGPITSESEVGIDDALKRLADNANVALKFTAIPLNSLAEQGIDAAAVLARYIALFGADRLLWGSDITQSAGTYANMADLARRAVAGFDTDTRAMLLHDNAVRIYGI